MRHGLQVPAAAPLVVVLSGPSGVGKDAVIKRLQQQNAERLKFVVTATSRQVFCSIHCNMNIQAYASNAALMQDQCFDNCNA